MASNEPIPPVEKKEKLEPQIKSVDMSDDMQQEAIEVGRSPPSSPPPRAQSDEKAAQEAMEKFNIEKDIATHIKREFDARKGATWHCIVGRNFGSFVTHDFTSPLKGYESITPQCRNCGNWSAHCISSWEWFTICWIPVIPLGGKHQEIACSICRFRQDLRDRPDVQSQINGGGGGAFPVAGQGGPPQGWGGGPQQNLAQPAYQQGAYQQGPGQPQYK
ncbi:hypothetical protein DV738_g3948, partial [Chaetothyriales sp. CBS 135597]